MTRKKIAFKSHETRGEEIIKILEGMGGVNKYNLDGSKGIIAIETNRGNYITNDWDYCGLIMNGWEIYTLEGYEKIEETKTKYEPGDRVRIKPIEWYNENKDEEGYVKCKNGIVFVNDMSKYCGKILTIENVGYEAYGMKEDKNGYVFPDEAIEGLAEEEKSFEFKVNDFEDAYEELTDRAFKGGYEKCKSDIELNGFQLPEGYIFKDENGNEINAQKIVLEKKTVEEKYSDVKIQIFGNVVILKGGINADNPTEYMNEVVHYIVKLLGNPKHNQFIEEFLDNPWVRILVFDFNSMEFNNSFDDIVTNFKQ